MAARGRAKRLPAILILAAAMQARDFTLLINAQIGGPFLGANLKTLPATALFGAAFYELYKFLS